jgi:predicted DNA-binding transcriptional regulator AlpA
MSASATHRSRLRASLAQLPPLLTPNELADALRVTYWSLRHYAKRPGFPKPVWLTPNTRRWVRDEVIAWVEAASPSRRRQRRRQQKA